MRAANALVSLCGYMYTGPSEPSLFAYAISTKIPSSSGLYCKFGNFREGFIFAKLRKHFVLHKCRKSMPKSRFFKVANKSFKAIRENKILAKIPEFTVLHTSCVYDHREKNQIKLL